MRSNCPPATIWIWLGVIAHEIKVRKVFANRGERISLVLPAFGKVGFAARTGGHAGENGGGRGVQLRFTCADHVDGYAFGLRQLVDVLGRNHAGIIRAIGKNNHDFAPSVLRGVF